MFSTIVLAISIVLQFVAAAYSLRLISISGKRFAWVLISVAIALMGLRRSITFVNAISSGSMSSLNLNAELVALVISLLMVLGICLLKPLFESIQKSQHALHVSQSRLTEAQKIAKIGSFEGEVSSDELWWSDELYFLFGLSPVNFLPTKDSFTALLHPDDKVEYIAALMSCLESGEPLKRKFRAKHSSGEYRHFETIANVTFDNTGQVLGLQGFVQDITERKQAEDALKNSQQQLDSFFEESPAGLAIVDDQLRYLKINKTLAEINGSTIAEHIGRTAQQIMPELAPTIEPMFRKVINEGVSYLNVEVNGETPNQPGALRQWMVSYFPIKGIDDGIQAVGVVVIETTERKQAELALRTSEKLYIDLHEQMHLALESITDGFALYDSQDRLVVCNSRYKEIYKESEDLLVPGKKFEDHIRESASRGQVTEAVGREEEWVQERLKQHQNPDGIYLQQLGNGRWLQICERKTADGGIVGVRTDITERKLAEKALKERELHFRLFSLSTGDCFWNWDMVAGTVERSSGFERAFGYQPHEILSGIEWWSDRIHPEDKEKVFDLFETAVAGKQSTCEYEYRFRCQDGSYATINDHVCFISDACGNVVRSLGTMQDITERKLAENTMRANEEKYRTLVEASPYCIHQIDSKGRFISMNRAGLEMINESDECVIRGVPYLSAVCQEDQERISKMLDAALFGESAEFEFRGTEDQEFRSNFVPIYGSNGQVDRLLGITQDITDRKQVQTELQHSQGLLSKAQEIAHIGSYEWDINRNQIVWSDEMYHIYGINRDEFGGSIEDVMPLIHPDDRGRIQEGTERALREGTGNGLEFRIVTPDGTIKTVFAKAEFRDPTDKENPVFVGFVQDVTESRRYAKVLSAEMKILELIASDAPLSKTLEVIVQETEALSEGLQSTILLLDESGKRLKHAAAVSLPQEYNKAIDGIEIGPNVGSCGTAAFLNRRVIVKEIATDPLWVDFKELATSFNLAACWSMPINSSSGTVLGTFALYHSEPKEPDEFQLQMIERAAQLASIAIEKHKTQEALLRSEEHFRTIFEHEPECVVILDRSGSVVDMNPAGVAMFGAESLSEIKEQCVYPQVIAEYRANYIDAVEEAFEGKSPTIQFEFESLDGRRLWLESHNVPLQNSATGSAVILSVTRDVTEQTRAWDRQRMTQFAVEHSAEPIYWVRSDASIAYANIAASHMLGYTAEELMSMSVPQIDPNFPAELWPVHWQEMKNAGSMSFEAHHQSKEGTVFPVEVYTNFVTYDTREYIWVYILDTTERKKAKEILRQREIELAHVGRLSTMGEMVGGIIHEMGQPLYAIINFADACLASLQNDSEKQNLELNGWIEKIGKAARHTGSIVSRLRDFSRQTESRIEQVVVREMILESLEIMSFQIQKLNITVQVQCPEELVASVDRVQMEQVLINLIQNACDSTESNPDNHREIILGVIQEQGKILISVKDNGVGLDESARVSLFDAFYTTKLKGMGMGLAISKTIVENHRGKISFTENDDQGLTFHITLPCNQELLEANHKR